MTGVYACINKVVLNLFSLVHLEVPHVIDCPPLGVMS
jgi:hypothetical protein